MSTSSIGHVVFLSVVLFMVFGILALAITATVSFWTDSWYYAAAWYNEAYGAGVSSALSLQGLYALLAWSVLFSLYIIVNLSARCCCASTWITSVMCDLIMLSAFTLYGIAAGAVCVAASAQGMQSIGWDLSLVMCVSAGGVTLIVTIMLIGWILGEAIGVKRRYGSGSAFRKSLRQLQRESKKKTAGQTYAYPGMQYAMVPPQQGMYPQAHGMYPQASYGQPAQPGVQPMMYTPQGYAAAPLAAPQPGFQLSAQNTSDSASYSTKSLITDTSAPGLETPPVNAVTYVNPLPSPAPPPKDALPQPTTYTVTDAGVPIRAPGDPNAPLPKP